MAESHVWRVVLGSIIKDHQEKHRLASELGVNVVTLSRWAKNESDPRPLNLRYLLKALPHHRAELLKSITEEFPEFTLVSEEDEDIFQEIPSTFYARVLSDLEVSLPNLRFWPLCNLILQQALEQLDPFRLGLSITIAQCMPPTLGKKVRSLHERIGRGTSPWEKVLDDQAAFLGAESLAGHAVISGHPATVVKRGEHPVLYVGRWPYHEESSFACPILRSSKFAGSLLVSSTQSTFFLSDSRRRVIQQYASLIALVFDPEEFYAAQDIELVVMPCPSKQEPIIATFHERFTQLTNQAAQQQEPMSNTEAELKVWGQLEQELARLAKTPGDQSSDEGSASSIDG